MPDKPNLPSLALISWSIDCSLSLSGLVMRMHNIDLHIESYAAAAFLNALL